MHPDDLKKAWLCHQCKALFIYYSDKQYHTETTGHRKFAVFDLASGRMLKDGKSEAFASI